MSANTWAKMVKNSSRPGPEKEPKVDLETHQASKETENDVSWSTHRVSSENQVATNSTEDTWQRNEASNADSEGESRKTANSLTRGLEETPEPSKEPDTDST